MRWPKPAPKPKPPPKIEKPKTDCILAQIQYRIVVRNVLGMNGQQQARANLADHDSVHQAALVDHQAGRHIMDNAHVFVLSHVHISRADTHALILRLPQGRPCRRGRGAEVPSPFLAQHTHLEPTLARHDALAFGVHLRSLIETTTS